MQTFKAKKRILSSAKLSEAKKQGFYFLQDSKAKKEGFYFLQNFKRLKKQGVSFLQTLKSCKNKQIATFTNLKAFLSLFMDFLPNIGFLAKIFESTVLHEFSMYVDNFLTSMKLT